MNKEKLIVEIEKVYEKTEELKTLISHYPKIIILGNGGSNSISSHIAQDYTKVLRKEAVAFSDPSRLTCYINDYGMENAYAQFLHEFASSYETLAILISSSGNSKNMVKATDFCVQEHVDFIILTGFDEDNQMRKQSHAHECKLDCWVDSKDYGIVECVHQIFLHSIL